MMKIPEWPSMPTNNDYTYAVHEARWLTVREVVEEVDIWIGLATQF